jgi:selenocysteine lyase/cysteine desulfurase
MAMEPDDTRLSVGAAPARARRLDRFDAAFARTLFPAFSAEMPPAWAFLDNAGGTYPCGPVLDRFFRFWRDNKVQPYGFNALAKAAGEQMDEGRGVLAELLNVDAATLTLGPSTTQNLNTLAHACEPLVGPGLEIVVSGQEHEANFGCWERLARRTGATFRVWPADPATGELEVAGLERILTEKTRLVCVTHASNILATVNPVSEVASLVHHAGGRLVVDAVSYAPHHWPRIRETSADAYAFSTYKTFATHLGVLRVAPDFLSDLAPQCHYFNEGKPWMRLDAAGPIHGSIAALAGLGDFVRALHARHYAESSGPLHTLAAEVSVLSNAHEAALSGRLLAGLRELPVRVLGRDSPLGREATVSLASRTHSSAELNAHLAERGVAAKNGHFYAARLIETLGFEDPGDGVLRLSFSLYNTIDEVDRALEALREVLRN